MKLLNKVNTVILTGSLYAASALPAFAQNLNPCDATNATTNTDFNGLCELNADGSGSIIANAIVAIFVIAAIIALAFLIWGGVKWITSGGDKAKVESARSTIIAAIIGLIIVFLSYFILNIILGLFDLNLGSLQLPSLREGLTDGS